MNIYDCGEKIVEIARKKNIDPVDYTIELYEQQKVRLPFRKFERMLVFIHYWNIATKKEVGK